MDKFNSKRLITTFLLLAIIGFLSVILPIILIALPVLICSLYYNSSMKNAIIGYLIFALCLFLISRQYLTIIIISMTLPLCISVIWALVNKQRMFNNVIITTVSAIFGCFLLIGLLSLVSNTGFTSLFTSTFKQILSLDEMYTKSFYLIINDQSQLANYLATGALPAGYETISMSIMQDYIIKEAILTIPYFIIMYSVISGFFGYYLPHRYLAKHGHDLVKVASFHDLKVPRQPMTALCIMLIVCLILERAGMDIFTQMSSVLIMVFAIVMSVQGYSVISFFYKNKKYSAIIAIVVAVIATLVGFIFWLGFIESMLQVRVRFLIANSKDGDKL